MIDWSNVLKMLARKALPLCLAGLFSCAGERDNAPVSSVNETLVSTQPLAATLTVTSRWSTGYCAAVSVRNTGPATVNGWNVDIRADGTLTTSWNVTTSVSSGLVHATAVAHNAVLEVGAEAQFGFCASASPRARPAVTGASGQVGDPGTGYSAVLTLDSDWGTGYCATVSVQNDTPSTLWTWTVVLELNASRLTSSWGVRTRSSGSRLTATPLSYNSVLAPGAAVTFGFCGQATGPNYRPVLISPSGEGATKLTVAVYLPHRIATCFIGDPCTPGSDGCIGLRDDDNVLVEGFVDATFQAVRTSSPQRRGANKEVCVEMVMSGEERAEIMSELALFQSNVRQWSHSDIQLDLRVLDFDRLDMDESRWGGGVWIGPWNLTEFALPRLDFAPDFNLVIPPIRDPSLRLHHDLGGCGGTFGADLGIAGAGWSWVPKTKSSFWFDCAEQPTVTHEWLHQVHYGYQNLSGFSDLYGWSLPACTMGDPNPLRWFPDSHQCDQDPDYDRCGSGDCGGNDAVNSHILSAHWDPALDFVSNHCKDGVQDYDETAVDSGPSCLPQRSQPVRFAPPPREPARSTPTP
jgi:hypothetical protein